MMQWRGLLLDERFQRVYSGTFVKFILFVMQSFGVGSTPESAAAK